jgi:hypothetical protein
MDPIGTSRRSRRIRQKIGQSLLIGGAVFVVFVGMAANEHIFGPFHPGNVGTKITLVLVALGLVLSSNFVLERVFGVYLWGRPRRGRHPGLPSRRQQRRYKGQGRRDAVYDG